ncbi:sigma-70 family RNA polymerase sigma factor [Ornithinibacillus scapharcae]|uniref:sigma-70 family RNA polymerase sigma factor n=1 Tax=Ornithinibacillus scapharcae TaxID=1147159 RepID=UPI000225B3BF|nr:sigma-70 family RNA polymerase sigma factor [Ornithinibacillus scapharcae]
MNRPEPLTITEESTVSKEEIISEIMQDYGDDTLHLVFTYVKNLATAEDLTQEIFIKCYEKLEQFNHQSSIKTWLYRIASNHCKDYLRSWQYRKIVLNEKIGNETPSNSKQVEEEVIANKQEKSLSYAVMSLPVKYREVVVLHYYEEMTLTEISSVTKVNVNTLKTRLKRAKELLKNKMKKEV